MTGLHVRAVMLLALAPIAAAAGETRRPPCPADAPPGVRLPDRPGCREREAAPARGGPPSFIDLGGGTRVRISGRARGEVDVRR